VEDTASLEAGFEDDFPHPSYLVGTALSQLQAGLAWGQRDVPQARDSAPFTQCGGVPAVAAPSVGKCQRQVTGTVPMLLKSPSRSGQVRSGQVRFITRPKTRTMRATVTRQLMLPPSTVFSNLSTLE
jgi:hypothetical protein